MRGWGFSTRRGRSCFASSLTGVRAVDQLPPSGDNTHQISRRSRMNAEYESWAETLDTLADP